MKILTLIARFVVVFSMLSLHAIEVAAQVEPNAAKRLALVADDQELEASFTREATECYKKFAVNSCLDKISTKKRVAKARLKDEENLLNDIERKEKGARQINKTAANSSPKKFQEDIDRQIKSTDEPQVGAAQKAEPHQQPGLPVSVNTVKTLDASEKKRLATQEKIKARNQKEINASENAKRFKDREKASSERRIQHEIAQENQMKSLAKPLPLPE